MAAVDSPRLAIPAELLLVPSSLHMSSVCLSSPRPRRLTFLLAVADCISPGSPPSSSRHCQKEENAYCSQTSARAS